MSLSFFFHSQLGDTRIVSVVEGARYRGLERLFSKFIHYYYYFPFRVAFPACERREWGILNGLYLVLIDYLYFAHWFSIVAVFGFVTFIAFTKLKAKCSSRNLCFTLNLQFRQVKGKYPDTKYRIVFCCFNLKRVEIKNRSMTWC